MKITVTEYCEFFTNLSKDNVQAMCRNGELDAIKDEKGHWMINIDIPKDIYEMRQEVKKKVAYRNALYRKYRETNKEIEQLMCKIMEFTKQYE